MRHSMRLVLVCLALAAWLGSRQSALGARAQGEDALTLLDTIEVDGRPESIVVDSYAGRNDIAFYDLSAQKVRFMDGDTLALAPEEIAIDTVWDGWMAYDRVHHWTYVLETDTSRPAWDEVLVHVIGWRSWLCAFSVNARFNDPQPQDDRYGINGLAFQQPMSEGNNPGRLIIDNTASGIIDVVDFNATGTGAARVQRHAYRDRVPGSGWQSNLGNSLALETQHETLAVDDLDSTDILYIADQNRPWDNGYGYIRAVRLHHPLQDLEATALPEVDLNATWPFPNGLQGIALAGPRDVLCIASGLQSFDSGYVAEVDTTDNQLDHVVELTYGDQGFVCVDWYDPRRVFVATFDGFYNDPHQALYLHLIYDGAVVDSLPLLDDYDEYEGLRGMAFDPYRRRLYLTVGGQVMVVQVDYGAGPPALPAPPPVIAWTTLKSPWYFGSLDTPDGSAHLDFYPGMVDQTTVVTYTGSAPSPTGDRFGVRFFDLSAVFSASGTPAVLKSTYRIVITYTDAEKGPALEDTLALCAWDGEQWVREPTSQVDLAANTLTAYPNHMSRFAVLGETQRVYLPLIMRSPTGAEAGRS